MACWRRILRCIVIVRSSLRLLKLDKLAGGGGLTQCHGVLDHGLNLHQNIPLIVYNESNSVIGVQC